jgi:hypothetical protein
MDLVVTLLGPGLLVGGVWLAAQGHTLLALGAGALGGALLVVAVFHVGRAAPAHVQTPTEHPGPGGAAPKGTRTYDAPHKAPADNSTLTQDPPARDPDDVDDTRLLTFPDGQQRPVLATLATWEAFDFLTERAEDAQEMLTGLARDLSARDSLSLEDAFAQVVVRAYRQWNAPA